jgi:hypothetical protein
MLEPPVLLSVATVHVMQLLAAEKLVREAIQL